MFRIKNTRAITVAKNTNISPQVLSPIPQPQLKPSAAQQNPIKKINPNTNVRKVYKQNLPNQTSIKNTSKANESNKISTLNPNKLINTKTKLNTTNKNLIINNPRIDQLSEQIKKTVISIDKNIQIKNNTNSNILKINDKNKTNIKQVRNSIKKITVQNNKIDQPVQQNKTDPIININHKNIDINKTIQNKQKQQSTYILSKNQQISHKKQQQQINKFIQKQISQREKASVQLQNQKQRKQKQQKQREQRLRQRKLKKQKQEQQQLNRIAQAQEQIAKIMQRRKQRQKQRSRMKQLQQKRQKQLKLLSQHMSNNNSNISGMLHTTDPLAHFQLSQRIMDMQINKIIKMSFLDFPSGQFIERKKQQLQRINTSYIMIRDGDGGNQRIRDGLNGYRTQLFNQIGQLIVNDQKKGYNNPNFQLIQTDNNNASSKLIPSQVTITRGIPAHKISTILKQSIAVNEHQCSICLQEIRKQSKFYQLICKHAFHIQCVQDWVVNTGNCPVCRKNLKFN